MYVCVWSYDVCLYVRCSVTVIRFLWDGGTGFHRPVLLKTIEDCLEVLHVLIDEVKLLVGHLLVCPELLDFSLLVALALILLSILLCEEFLPDHRAWILEVGLVGVGPFTTESLYVVNGEEDLRELWGLAQELLTGLLFFVQKGAFLCLDLVKLKS